MSDHYHHNNGSGVINSFVLGALIGAGVVFLFGTKRGKKLVKDFSEKGLSALEEWEGLFSELEEETVQETPSLTPTEPSYSVERETEITNNAPKNGTYSSDDNSSQPPTHIESLQSHGRHFFSGIPKRR